MNTGTSLTVFVTGVLAYKAVELFILREKVEQTGIRTSKPGAITRPAVLSSVWLRGVRLLRQEFALVSMIYFLVIAAVAGFFYIFARDVGNLDTIKSVVLSTVTIVASMFLACLNLIVERCRTVVES
jgi:hypothetical protein